MRSYLLAHPLFTKKILKKLFIGTLLDFSPTLVFVVAYECSNFFTATGWFIGSTVIASLVAVVREKRVPYFSIYIALVTLFFGGTTLFFHDPHFIQMRDTFYDVVLGLTVLISYLHGKLVFKSVFSHSVSMSDEAWNGLTHAWIFFFFGAAFSNELARYSLSPGGWVYFKVLMLFVTMCFGFWALFYYFEPRMESEK
jgi:intracellular septation protein